MDLLKHENDMLTLKIASVDDSTRAMNLRVEGVPESQNENIKKEILVRLLVRLQREGLRHAILTNKAKISQNSPTTIWVNDNVSDVTRSLR